VTAASTGLFRSLGYRNYRLYFGGQSISSMGTWMQMAAQQWLVYRLTASGTVLGVIGFLGNIPSVVVGPLAGAVLDRYDRRTVLLATQSSAALLAFVLAWLVLTGQVAVWHLLVLAFLLGVVNAVDMPARQSFVADIVERKTDFGNAVALNSMLFHATRMAGPPIAGLGIGAAGEGWCFLINGLTFFAIVAALYCIRPVQRATPNKTTSLFTALREGFAYAWGASQIRLLLSNVMLVSLLVMPYVVVMPIYVKEHLAGGAASFGLLMGAGGAGALIGALYLAAQGETATLWRLIPAGGMVAGSALVGLSYVTTTGPAMAALLAVGFGTMTQFASASTLLQTVVDDDRRGRVMSLYTTSFAGCMPFGNLLIGWLTEAVGPSGALRLCGAAAIAAAVTFTTQRHLTDRR